MSLKVNGDAEFTKLVQEALTKICPCQSVTVDTITGVVSLGTMLCSCYCDHPAGCNLLTDLVGDAREIPVYTSAGDGSGYDVNGVGWLTADVPSQDRDTCGKTALPAWSQLAHELVHALRKSGDEDEDNCVRGENQIRGERCVPMRTEYNGAVENFSDRILDANVRSANCNCSVWSGGIFRASRRVYCALYSRFCIPGIVAALRAFPIPIKVRVPRPFPSHDLPPQKQIADAIRVRTRISMATEVDHSRPLLPDAEWEVTLESISLVGLYRALVIAVRGDEVRMLTNFTLRPNGRPYMSTPGTRLASSQALSMPLAETIRDRLSQIRFSEGGGGSATAADGAVTFLSIRQGSQERKTALYYYHFPATANHWHRPDGVDGERWDAMNTVYEIWREVASNPAVNSPPT